MYSNVKEMLRKKSPRCAAAVDKICLKRPTKRYIEKKIFFSVSQWSEWSDFSPCFCPAFLATELLHTVTDRLWIPYLAYSAALEVRIHSSSAYYQHSMGLQAHSGSSCISLSLSIVSFEWVLAKKNTSLS